MNITINIKHFKIEAKTKSQILKIISKDHVKSYGIGQSYLIKLKPSSNLPKYKRVYNLEKFRPKFKQVKINKNGKKITKSEKIREGKWIAYVYDVPFFICVYQCNKNFKIIRD